jgi:hypothetical protein
MFKIIFSLIFTGGLVLPSRSGMEAETALLSDVSSL